MTLGDSALIFSKSAGPAAVKPWEWAGVSFGLFMLLGMAMIVAIAAAALAIFS